MDTPADETQAYEQAVAVVREQRRCSVSLIQRHLRIGYNCALRLVERMEQERVIARAPADDDACWQVVGSDGTLLPLAPEPPDIPVKEMMHRAREARRHGLTLSEWMKTQPELGAMGAGDPATPD